MLKVLSIIFLLIAIQACSSGKPKKEDTEHVPPHGGIILQGNYFHLEILGTHSEVKVYPFNLNTDGTFQNIDLKKAKITVEYSPYRSKSDYQSYMVNKEDHFWGEINDRHEKGYQLYIKLIYDGHTDRFVYVVRPKK